jgi:hypothetical protein
MDQAMGIGQSEPWNEEGRWSCVQANTKQPLLGYQKFLSGWDKGEKDDKSGPNMRPERKIESRRNTVLGENFILFFQGINEWIP